MATLDDEFDEKLAKQIQRSKDVEHEQKMRSSREYYIEHTKRLDVVYERIQAVVKEAESYGHTLTEEDVLDEIRESL